MHTGFFNLKDLKDKSTTIQTCNSILLYVSEKCKQIVYKHTMDLDFWNLGQHPLEVILRGHLGV